MNKVILIGNLGADSQARYTQNGTYLLKLRLATNERRKVNDQWEDHTEWHDVTVFGKRAEGLAQYLFKGIKIAVEGRLETQSWDDNETGQKRYRTGIIAEDIELLSPRGDSEQRPPPQQPPQTRNAQAQRIQRGWQPPPQQAPQRQPPPPRVPPMQAPQRPPEPSEQDGWELSGGEPGPDYDPFGQYGGPQ